MNSKVNKIYNQKDHAGMVPIPIILVTNNILIQSKRSCGYGTHNIVTRQVNRFINNILRLKKGQYLKLFKFEI